MRRRDFLGLWSGAVVAMPRAAYAQQPEMQVIGLLNGQSAETYS